MIANVEELKDAADVVNMLNKQSGLFGVSGFSSDMRDIEAGIQAHNPDAVLAYNIFIDRIKKFIGQYLAVLNGADAIVFTAGMGENAPLMRNDVVEGLSWFGIELDLEKMYSATMVTFQRQNQKFVSWLFRRMKNWLLRVKWNA